MIKKSLVYLVSIGLYACIVQPVSAALTESQKNYVAARAALKSGDDYSYQRLKRRLADYPLVLYLNYHEKIDHLDGLSASQFAKWSAQFEDSPLYQGARHRFLMSAGKQEHWQDFLSISPSAPNSIELQCYYYQAQLAKGDKQAAFDGAKTLWLYGASQPKTCDELFSKWSNAGELSEALIWQRMLLAFDAKQLGLMSHLAKSMKSHKAQAQLLIDVYGDPKQLRHTQKFKKSDPLVADVVTIGLRKLAQTNLSKAFSLYQSYQQKGLFSKQQSQLAAHALVRRALINQDVEYLSRIDSLLPMINSDDVTEMRLRWAIRDNDLKSLTQFLPLLSPEAQQESRWQYWTARSRNDIELLKKLSAQRNFYGFYAAEQLQQDYQMAHNQLPALSQQQQRELQQTPGFLRMLEFKALDKKGSARIEWDYLIQNSDNGPAFGQLAIIKGWPELAIQATIAGKHWDHLALRFPIAFKDSMQAAARRHQVDLYEILAIARRESAMFPLARSSAGAMGLMQVMPATAKQTAKRYSLPYSKDTQLLEPKYNANIGTGYYKYLLEKYNGNRVLAIGAYNAGPSRIASWLARADGQLDTMAFIESIPFKETREYVQAVISYRIIYEALHSNGKVAPLFTDSEMQFAY